MRYCTAFAECALDVDSGNYYFHADAPSDCTPPNPAECPESFAAAQALEGTTLSPAPAPSDAGADIACPTRAQ